MTWRVCSTPWPGRPNPGSWPGRRQCGLPSARPPLRAASPPLPGGQCGAEGPGGPGDLPVPGPGWPRRWSRQWPGWAVSSRPIRACCPAPFSSWPTSPWRRRRRLVVARTGPPTRRGRGGPRGPRTRSPAILPPGRTARRPPPRSPARRDLRSPGISRSPRGHPVTAAPMRAAVLARRARRVRRRRVRPSPACRPGSRLCTAGASPRGPRPARRPRPSPR
jgi:hypothetical protein